MQGQVITMCCVTQWYYSGNADVNTFTLTMDTLQDSSSQFNGDNRDVQLA